jgi:hypothetical protein
MPKAIMRPLQEFCAQPSSIKCFSVLDRADPAASLKLRHQFQPRLKVWPHYDVPPLFWSERFFRYRTLFRAIRFVQLLIA